MPLMIHDDSVVPLVGKMKQLFFQAGDWRCNFLSLAESKSENTDPW